MSLEPASWIKSGCDALSRDRDTNWRIAQQVRDVQTHLVGEWVGRIPKLARSKKAGSLGFPLAESFWSKA